jgi:hypothetical protein
MSKEIKYGDIIDLGFEVEECNDPVYFKNHGFQYCIITKKLTKRIYIDWAKETKLCEMIRVDSEDNIKAKHPIKSLAELKYIIDFFTK